MDSQHLSLILNEQQHAVSFLQDNSQVFVEMNQEADY